MLYYKQHNEMLYDISVHKCRLLGERRASERRQGRELRETWHLRAAVEDASEVHK